MMQSPAWWKELLAVSELLTVEEREDAFISQMGDLAYAYAEASAHLSNAQKSHFMSLLETVMAAGGEDEVAAVATGFFESLLNQWDEGYDLRSTWPFMGPKSQSHCLAWNKFWGVDSPSWMRQS